MRIWNPGDCANHLSTESLSFSGKASALECIKQTRVRISCCLCCLTCKEGGCEKLKYKFMLQIEDKRKVFH